MFGLAFYWEPRNLMDPSCSEVKLQLEVSSNNKLHHDTNLSDLET